MRVLIDTVVWSLALRRRPGDLSAAERAVVLTLRDVIRRGLAVLIGPVRQELLTGVTDPAAFDRLREYLRDFEDDALNTDDYEQAALCNNTCRSAGIAGSAVDYLLCAFALQRDLPIFTIDRDFPRYAGQLPIRLPSSQEIAAELRRVSGEQANDEA